MTAFTGFPEDALTFLHELRDHNERDWFNAQKARYEASVREPARAFVRAMAPHLALLAPSLVADDRKTGGSLMRIYRDTRFSKDKRPYKTNVGIHFRHRAGKNVHAPGLYVHLEPDEVFVGVGLWMPDKQPLAAIRTAISQRASAWRSVSDRPGWERHGQESKLKRVPRGFDKDDPMADELKFKSFLLVKHLPPSEATTDDFDETIADHLREVIPFVSFLCDAVGQPL